MNICNDTKESKTLPPEILGNIYDIDGSLYLLCNYDGLKRCFNLKTGTIKSVTSCFGYIATVVVDVTDQYCLTKVK